MKVLFVVEIPNEEEAKTIEKVLGEEVAYALVESEYIELRELTALEEILLNLNLKGDGGYKWKEVVKHVSLAPL